MLKISNTICLSSDELFISAIRAQGAGGQNVNKVSTAVHLRFDIRASSLPEFYQQRLLELKDSRISKDGVVVIKAQQFRSQEKNREAALERLKQLVQSVAIQQKTRKATKPSKSAKKKRTDAKVQRGKIKSMRGKVSF